MERGDRGRSLIRQRGSVTPVQALVFGRLAADLYPLQERTLLEDVETFQRFVGGFGGNVGTGLARLGVATAVLSAVGDDGHGRFLRKALANEGIETRWLGTHPWLRTALAFSERWPPDHFPLTLYRRPSCPDWEIEATDLPMDLISSAPLLYVSGTALAQDPSRSAVHAALSSRDKGAPGAVATILDLDWRMESWEYPEQYPEQIANAMKQVDTVIGGVAEFAAAELTPKGALDRGIERVFLKRGPDGAALLHGAERHEVDPLSVEVVNGLGAGDAFAATVGQGLLAELDETTILRRANAAGAMVTMRLPCAAAMPSRDELKAFLAAQT